MIWVAQSNRNQRKVTNGVETGEHRAAKDGSGKRITKAISLAHAGYRNGAEKAGIFRMAMHRQSSLQPRNEVDHAKQTANDVAKSVWSEKKGKIGAPKVRGGHKVMSVVFGAHSAIRAHSG